ncbi:hypothetical protein FGG08_003135 [Glutinoglossum americanum]|uniref:Uncharacterized protein n=1 Tax=Glutinoglossum americanum TaxID=1670608 RepID=A0A9P8L3V5_9PEZI|nr:hypothetical protein FGG08_003135 [Glutinoglossum americanum]
MLFVTPTLPTQKEVRCLKDLVLDLVLALQSLPAARVLSSPDSRGTLLGDLSRLNSAVDSGDFDVTSATPLLGKVIDKASDADIWSAFYDLVVQSTPPPRLLPYLDRTYQPTTPTHDYAIEPYRNGSTTIYTDNDKPTASKPTVTKPTVTKSAVTKPAVTKPAAK